MRNQRSLAFVRVDSLDFGTKAETLGALSGVLKSATILPQLHFTLERWKTEQAEVVKEVEASGWLAAPGAAVRSSARAEDGKTSSLAGHFLSLLNVSDRTAVIRAIDQVFASYGKPTDAEQVLIQPMVKQVAASGVAFGVEPSSGSSYFVVNYDDHSGSTSSVTSGGSSHLKTFYCYEDAGVELPPLMNGVVTLLKELRELFGTNHLDIEFATDRAGKVFLLQCRPLTAAKAAEDKGVNEALTRIEAKFVSLSSRHPYLLGNRTVFGVMPDWNPAEIVGIRPRPLALSLYRELVTDSIWAYQRDNYGYRNLRSFPLLVDFCGLPYIDVRVSFNSFVPEDLEEALGEKLVNYYIDKLIQFPTHHDKVEFEIVYTCYTFDLPKRLESLDKAGFSEKERNRLKDCLIKLTNRIIDKDKGLWKKDIEKIGILDKRLAQIRESQLDTTSKIYWLLEDCKRYGTLPFAGLARAGFIAVQMLRSLVAVGVLSRTEYDRFLSSLETVSSRLSRDFSACSQNEFLARYGHLRPGTYDVLSPRYDEAPNKYFDWSKRTHCATKESEPFVLSLDQLRKIETLLKDHHLEHDILGFFDFIRSAIEGREFAKFVFTKSLSEGLSLLKTLASEHGLSTEDCSFLDISAVRHLYASSESPRETLERSAKEGREAYELTKQITLPPLMVRPEDVWAFEVPANDPNFITQRRVSAPVVEASQDKALFKNAILFIPSADPGYDWIFSHGIAGLVTMFGGTNSHMAIRAGELDIPAVIGAGEQLYHLWSKAAEIEVDCLNRQVRIVRG